MLLNQMRCEDGDPENLLRNSFYQFQADRAIPDLEVSCFLQMPYVMKLQSQSLVAFFFRINIFTFVS